jgi:hypothetical protein
MSLRVRSRWREIEPVKQNCKTEYYILQFWFTGSAKFYFTVLIYELCSASVIFRFVNTSLIN